MGDRRYLAVDIEIAAIFPNDSSDWKSHRPLGITCAALAWQGSDGIETHALYGSSIGHSVPAPRMTIEECRGLVRDLRHLVDRGHTLLTWNGLGFDFDILAEESGMHAECVELALNHTDMMFQILCLKGFPLGLDAVAKGLGLVGKTEGMSGTKAPEMWAYGEHAKVLEYVQQDVRTTLEVALAVEEQGGFSWIAKSGRRNQLDIKQWLTVRDALLIPEPDQSWMSNPMLRSSFVEWMQPQKTE